MHPTVTMCDAKDNSSILMSTFQDMNANRKTTDARCVAFIAYYQNLQKEHRPAFLSLLARDYGVDKDKIVSLSYNVMSSQNKGDVMMLSSFDKLRWVLRPRYKTMFTHIARIPGGVKFLVDLRADVVTLKPTLTMDMDVALFQELNSILQELLMMWFTVGFLNLERITWNSPCDLVQKVSNYEAVHRIRTWEDIKQRVGPYRRCYIFTHNSMPREPVVVLHTALTSEISSNIHEIIHNARFRQSFDIDESYPDFLTSDSPLSSPSPSSPEATSSVSSSTSHPSGLSTTIRDNKEDPANINCAVFYSITSTQRGLQGIDMGNYLIKSVVKRLQEEFPQMTQFSSLSPIPGFREWLLIALNHSINKRNAGEDAGIPVLLPLELSAIEPYQTTNQFSALDTFKEYVMSNQWVRDAALSQVMKTPLMRLCAHYLFVQKRRCFALNPVANFHLSNGAMLWRINFMADSSVRGLNNSCGMMVNYRYYLDCTEANSQTYMETHQIPVSDMVLKLLNVDDPFKSGS